MDSKANTGFISPEWVHHTNIYEVNIRQYTPEGTFNAFRKELARLKDMEVQTLWFMPVQTIGKENRKGTLGSYYSISDHLAVNPEYGTADDLKHLIGEAHEMGFRVIIDWVANHTAWDHVWTKTNPGFYSKSNSGNFRPPFPVWEDVIHLNYDNKELWIPMADAMLYWVKEFDIDGFRCDMAHLVPLEFWRMARKKIDTLKPLFWMGETEEADYQEAFDAILTWEFLHKMEAYWRKETDMAGLESVLNKYENVFSKEGMRIYFTSNHDENSHSGSEFERMGNAALAFAVFCATWNGIPLVYSGQELPNKKRLRFFEKDVIPWKGKNELHEFYKIILRLHADHPALAAGNSTLTYRVKTSAGTNVFAYLRKKENREVLVVLNLSAQNDLHFDLPDDKITGLFSNVFSGATVELSSAKIFQMQAWDYLVYEK
jgi:glycosidase